MTKAKLEEFIRKHEANIVNGIEEEVVNGYSLQYFVEEGITVGGMIRFNEDEVCIVTLEGEMMCDLPDSFELMC